MWRTRQNSVDDLQRYKISVLQLYWILTHNYMELFVTSHNFSHPESVLPLTLKDNFTFFWKSVDYFNIVTYICFPEHLHLRSTHNKQLLTNFPKLRQRHDLFLKCSKMFDNVLETKLLRPFQIIHLQIEVKTNGYIFISWIKNMRWGKFTNILRVYRFAMSIAHWASWK